MLMNRIIKFLHYLTLEMEALFSSETSVKFYLTIWRHISENGTLQFKDTCPRPLGRGARKFCDAAVIFMFFFPHMKRVQCNASCCTDE
jgi:hypothetical protein